MWGLSPHWEIASMDSSLSCLPGATGIVAAWAPDMLGIAANYCLNRASHIATTSLYGFDLYPEPEFLESQLV